MLHKRGVNEADIAYMLEENPRRFFAGEAIAQSGESTGPPSPQPSQEVVATRMSLDDVDCRDSADRFD